MMKNDDGADFLPMRLLAVLVVTSLVLLASGEYVAQWADQSSKAAARACAAKIVATAAAEYAESVPGHGGTCIDVCVPGCVRWIALGAAETGGAGRSDGNVCCLQFADGSREYLAAGVPLGSGSGPAVLYPGRYTVRIRTETVNGSIMELIDAEAA